MYLKLRLKQSIQREPLKRNENCLLHQQMSVYWNTLKVKVTKRVGDDLKKHAVWKHNVGGGGGVAAMF